MTAPTHQSDWFSLFFLPLLKLEQAAELLDDVNQRTTVIVLAEEGTLRAINIACGKERREWRVWRYSVEWLGLSERRHARLPKHPDVATLLPHGRANFTLREVADFFQCDARHVRNLLADAEAGAVLRGPQFSERHIRISRAGLIDFLNQREINALLPTTTHTTTTK